MFKYHTMFPEFKVPGKAFKLNRAKLEKPVKHSELDNGNHNIHDYKKESIASKAKDLHQRYIAK